MKEHKKLVAVVVLGVVVAGVVYFLITGGTAAGSRSQSAPLVKTETPVRQAVATVLRFTGDIIPMQQAAIFSKVSGTLERVYVDMGARVGQGQVLARIDTTELYQQYQQAAATYQNARLTYARTRDLADQNLVSQQDVDNADAALKISRAACETAFTRLGYARITAPFSGYVTRRFLDPGALVTTNNATLFTVMDLDNVKVIVNVLEKDIPVLQKGRSATVTVDAYPGREFVGTVERFSEAVDLATRTMAAEIDIPNRDRLLKPGMFANVALVVQHRPEALTVPTQAVLRDDKGTYLYTAQGAMARRVGVTTGVEKDDRTEIVSGLSGTEEIIVVGQQFVRDGGPITRVSP